MSTPKRLVRPEVFSDLGSAVGPSLTDGQREKFNAALTLMRKVAQAATERFPKGIEQHENGVFGIISFIERSDEFLADIKRKVDNTIGERRQYFRNLGDDSKAFILGQAEGLFFKGAYDIQYALACIDLPNTSNGAAPEVYRISMLFKASNDTSGKLSEFLDSIGVSRDEFKRTLFVLRDTFMSKRGDSEGILEDKERISGMFQSLMEGYIDFHISGQPMIEPAMK